MMHKWKAISTLPKKSIQKISEADSLPVNDELITPRLEHNLLSSRECEKIIELSKSFTPTDAVVQKGLVDKYRQSEVRWLFPNEQTDWIFKRLDELTIKTNKYFKFDLLGFFTGIQIATYHEGGHYNWHMDTGLKQLSNRKLSISIQLSDPNDYSNGDLEFMAMRQTPKQISNMRQQGTAIVFPSFLNHRVNPVDKGVRRSLVCWVTGPPFK